MVDTATAMATATATTAATTSSAGGAAAEAAAGASAVSKRPRVGVLYTHASVVSREGEHLAKYLGLTIASAGFAGHVVVVGVALDPTSKRSSQHTASSSSGSDDGNSVEPLDTVALRPDGRVVKGTGLAGNVYQETTDLAALADCNVWILCVDSVATARTMRALQKRFPAPTVNAKSRHTGASTARRPKRVIVCLQPALRHLQSTEDAFPQDTVLHGGACFHVTVNKHDVLYPLSHGCFFVERLAANKVHALYALDLLESTGIQVLSRKSIQAMKWGHSLLRVFYYINALTGNSVHASLRDRACRLVFLQVLFELTTIFNTVTTAHAATASTTPASATSSARQQASAMAAWVPETSASTMLSMHAIMVLLPLPNWAFNTFVLPFVDLGLTASSVGFTTIARDVAAHRETEFEAEFKDAFDLAERRSVATPALTQLRQTLATMTATKQGSPRLAGRVLLASMPSTPASRRISRHFFVKLIVTILATGFLLAFLLRA